MYTNNEFVEFITANSAENVELEDVCVYRRRCRRLAQLSEELSGVIDPDCSEFGYDEFGDEFPF